MSKKKGADAFLKSMKSKKTSEFEQAFEVKKPAASNLDAFLEKVDLLDEEKSRLKTALTSQSKTQGIELGVIDQDYEELLRLSAEIRTITKQSVVLHGERIFKAQSILSKYRKGTFVSWLDLVYGNRQTPYSFLYYHNLYKEISKKDQELLKKMPLKAGYLLGAKSGSMELKLDIIRNHHSKTQKELVGLIQHTFPLGEKDRRRGGGSLSLARSTLENLNLLVNMKASLSAREFEILSQARERLDEILSLVTTC